MTSQEREERGTSGTPGKGAGTRPVRFRALREGFGEFVEIAQEMFQAFRAIGIGHMLALFLVGAYTMFHAPVLTGLAYAMRVLTWPWAAVVSRLTGRPLHKVQPYLRFDCIVRSGVTFANSGALGPLLAEADARERSALRLLPLLIGAVYGLTTFVNVIVLRAPFRLEPSDSKRFRVIVGEGEPLTRTDRALLLGLLSVAPVIVLVVVVARSGLLA